MPERLTQATGEDWNGSPEVKMPRVPVDITKPVAQGHAFGVKGTLRGDWTEPLKNIAHQKTNKEKYAYAISGLGFVVGFVRIP